MSHVDRILAALEAFGPVKRSGDKWRACCPAHGDKTPSLDIGVGDNGSVILKCQSRRCELDAIMAALGMSIADLYPDHDRRQSRAEVAHYPYHDEAGELLFDVVRFDPKDFRQRRPKPGGGWDWSVRGVRNVPYRLPQLLESADLGERVFVCEGERDCDALAKLNFIASCNAGGAGKWKFGADDLRRWFSGRNVVVCADNDEPGRKHAQQVASSLVGIASSIRMPEFAGVGDKGDVGDWLALGHTAEELEALVEATPLWTPAHVTAETSLKSGPRITTLRQAAENVIANLANGRSSLISTGTPDLDYALAGGVERGEMVILAARPSHGKSAFALQMAHGWTASGLPTLIVSEEMSALSLGKRTLQFASDMPTEHWQRSRERLAQDLDAFSKGRADCFVAESVGTAEAAVELIGRHVEQHGVQCVVVDYAQLLRSAGKNRYEQVSATSVALRQAASAHSVLLTALCQLNRAVEGRNSFTPTIADIRDSGQLEQDADVVLLGVWPHRLDSRRDPHDWQVFIGKNRNRAINQHAVACRFEPSRQRFSDPKAGKPFTIVAPTEADDDWGEAAHWER